MSFYTSLSGLRAAQTELATVSNNLANVTSTGFKKSRAQFGDLFSSSPTQTTKMIAGQGARLNAVNQQFTQGTLEATDRTLDMAIAGEGFFVVRGDTATGGVTYSRNGAFQVDVDHNVVDSLGSIMQLLPVDANGVATSSSLADSFDFVVPTAATGNPNALLSNLTVSSSRPLGMARRNWSVRSRSRALPRPKACARLVTRTGNRPMIRALRASERAIMARSARSARGRSNVPMSMSPRNWSH